MDDQPDVGEIDPHPESVGRDEDPGAALLEGLLGTLTGEGRSAAMVVTDTQP